MKLVSFLEAFCYDETMTELPKNELPEFIAITGFDGTGKGHLTQHLRDNYGFLTLGASDVIRSIKAERPHLQDLHLDEATRLLKEELGPTFITDTAMAKFKAERESYSGLVLDGVRRLPEIVRVKELGGKVLHVNADSQERFKRLASRARDDAPQTVEGMLARDAVQLQSNPNDKNGLNMKAIEELADGTVLNRFDDNFHEDAISVLKSLK